MKLHKADWAQHRHHPNFAIRRPRLPNSTVRFAYGPCLVCRLQQKELRMTYDEWFKAVDKECEKIFGMDSLSITGDWLSRDTYESGASVDEAVRVVYETANAFGELEDMGIECP